MRANGTWTDYAAKGERVKVKRTKHVGPPGWPSPDDFKDVRFKRHSTPERIIAAHWKPTGLTLRDLRKGDFKGASADGNTVRYTLADQIEGMRAMGMWGFADTTRRVVHYWHDGKRSAAELAMLFGHELAHLAHPTKRDSVANEMRCDLYGSIAATATRAAIRAKGGA